MDQLNVSPSVPATVTPHPDEVVRQLQQAMAQQQQTMEQLQGRLVSLDAQLRAESCRRTNYIVFRQRISPVPLRLPPRVNPGVLNPQQAALFPLVSNLPGAVQGVGSELQLPEGVVLTNLNFHDVVTADIIGQAARFYNDDFGIVAGDNLAKRQVKFRLWLLIRLRDANVLWGGA